MNNTTAAVPSGTYLLLGNAADFTWVGWLLNTCPLAVFLNKSETRIKPNTWLGGPSHCLLWVQVQIPS